MRLLTPQEVKQNRRLEEVGQIQRGAKIASLIDTEERKFKAKKEIFTKELAKIEADFLARIELLRTDEKTLMKEVLALERRKADASLPLKEREARIEQKELELKTWESKLQDKEETLGKNQEENREKMSLLLVRQDELSEREKKIQVGEIQLEHGLAFLRESNKMLAEKWTKFHREVTAANKEFLFREKKLSDREAALAVIEEAHDLEKEKIRLDREHLESQTLTLKTAFEEARKRNFLHG